MADLWTLYKAGKLPAVSCSDDVEYNAFTDGLRIQGNRIVKNLMKSMPEKSEEDIRVMCFCDVAEEENG